MEDYLWIIFFVIVGILRGVGWLMEQLKGPQQAQRPGGGRPPAGRAATGTPGAPRPQETPFQAMLRMIEEANQPAQEPKPRPRPQPQVRVAKPIRQPRPRPRPKEDHGGDLDQRHLKTAVGERHLTSDVEKRRLKSTLGTRHLRHLSHEAHRGEDHDEQPQAQLETQTAWDRLGDLSPIQRAVVMADVLGPGRHARRGTPYTSPR